MLRAIEAIHPTLRIGGLNPTISPVLNSPDTTRLRTAIEGVKPALRMADLSAKITAVRSPSTTRILRTIETTAKVAAYSEKTAAPVLRSKESNVASEVRPRAAVSAPVVNMNVTFNVTAASDSPAFRDELRKCGEELADTLRHRLQHEDRRSF